MLRKLTTGLAWGCGALLAALVCLICLNVVLRYGFNTPFIWTDQVVGYGMVYITFLGAPWVVARRRHIAVDILPELAGPQSRLLLNAVIGLVGSLYCAGFAYLAVGEMERILRRDSQFADAILVPQWTVYWTITAGSGLMASEFLLNALGDLRGYLGRGRLAADGS